MGPAKLALVLNQTSVQLLSASLVQLYNPTNHECPIWAFVRYNEKCPLILFFNSQFIWRFEGRSCWQQSNSFGERREEKNRNCFCDSPDEDHPNHKNMLLSSDRNSNDNVVIGSPYYTRKGWSEESWEERKMLKEILSRIISFNWEEKLDSHFIVNLRF